MSDVNTEPSGLANRIGLTPSQSINGILSDMTHNISTIPELYHQYINMTTEQNGNSLSDMGRIKLTKNLDFLLNILNLIFCTFEVDNLDRNRLLCTFVVSMPTNKCAIPSHSLLTRAGISRVKYASKGAYPLYTSPKEPFPNDNRRKASDRRMIVCWRSDGVVYLSGPVLRRNLRDQSDESPRTFQILLHDRWKLNPRHTCHSVALPRCLTSLAVGCEGRYSE